MISIETEARVAKILLLLADSEKESDIIRQRIGRHIAFDPFNIFRLIDLNLKNFIDEYDLYTFLKKLNVSSDLSEIKTLILLFDSDNDGTLNYYEFLNLLISDSDLTLRRLAEEKSSFYPNRDSFLTYEIEYSLSNLFESELNLVRRLSFLIKDLNQRYDFNIPKLFNILDEFNLNYIVPENIKIFLLRNDVSLLESEVLAVVKRIDVDRDSRITLTELRKIFSLSAPINSYLSSSYKSLEQRPLNSSIRASPVKKSSNYLSPVRERNVDQILSKSLTRSVDRSSLYNPNDSKVQSDYYPLIRPIFSYEDELFLDYLTELVVKSRELERLRCLIALKSDVSLGDLFKIFQYSGLSFLTVSDLKIGFNLFGLSPIEDDINLIIKRYDGTNVLGVFGFNDIFLPLDIEYSSLLRNRLTNFYGKVNPENYSFETRYLLENFFKALINTEYSLESLRQKLYLSTSFNVKSVFEKLDVLRKGYLTEEDLLRNSRINNLLSSKKDVDIVFQRFDLNKDLRISYSEFNDELFPKSREFLIRNSLI